MGGNLPTTGSSPGFSAARQSKGVSLMLVLSRKQGQSIVIANDIVVSVVHLGHGRVQIGVTAPSHMPVHREEVHRRIQSEKKTSRSTAYSTGELPSHNADCVGAA